MPRVFVFGNLQEDTEGLVDYIVGIVKAQAGIDYIKSRDMKDGDVLGLLKGNAVICGPLLKQGPIGFEPMLGAYFCKAAGITHMLFLEFWFKPRAHSVVKGDVEIVRKNPEDLEILKRWGMEAEANKAYAMACAAAAKSVFKSIPVNKANVKPGIEEIEGFFKGVF